MSLLSNIIPDSLSHVINSFPDRLSGCNMAEKSFLFDGTDDSTPRTNGSNIPAVLIILWLLAIKLPPMDGSPMDKPAPKCSLLNCPAQLWQTQSCGFLKGVNPSLIWSSSFPAAFNLSQYYCLFQRILPPHYGPKVTEP